MSNKRPFLLLYINDFLSSPVVQAMNDTQIKWYIWLLMRAWQSDPPCHLPNDKRQLMVLAGCKSEKQWDKMSGLVMSNFDLDESKKFLVNSRLMGEYEKMCQAHEKRASASRKRWQSTSNGDALHMQSNATHTQTHTHTHTKPRVKSQNAPAAPPHWLPLASWKAFLDMRRKLKKPLTVEAERLAIQKLDGLRSRGHPPEDVLNQSIMHSWLGLFEVKEKGNGTSKAEDRTRKNVENIRRGVELATGNGGGAYANGAHGGDDGPLDRAAGRVLAGGDKAGVPESHPRKPVLSRAGGDSGKDAATDP